MRSRQRQNLQQHYRDLTSAPGKVAVQCHLAATQRWTGPITGVKTGAGDTTVTGPITGVKTGAGDTTVTGPITGVKTGAGDTGISNGDPPQLIGEVPVPGALRNDGSIGQSSPWESSFLDRTKPAKPVRNRIW